MGTLVWSAPLVDISNHLAIGSQAFITSVKVSGQKAKLPGLVIAAQVLLFM